MAASWCKVASNLDSHPKIRKAGAMGREVFLFALRRNAEPNNPHPGFVPALELEPWYVADQLMRTEAETSEGLARCLAASLLCRDPLGYAIVGWDKKEWGKETSTERVRKWREKHDTKPDETLRNVSETPMKRTETDETARSDQRRSEETRREETREEEREASPPAPSPSVPRSKKRPTPKYTEDELAGIKLVLQKLTNRNQITYQGSEAHKALIASRLRAGYSTWDLRRVIAYCADHLGWQDNPDMIAYLRPETLFGPKTMEKYVYAARAWDPAGEPPEAAQQGPPKTENVRPGANGEASEQASNVIPLRPQPGILGMFDDPAFEEPSWMTQTQTQTTTQK